MSTRHFVAVSAGLVTTVADPRYPRIGLEPGYVAMLDEVALVPLVLAPQLGPESLDSLLEMASGLLLTGGDDIAPERYGRSPAKKLGATDPRRDAMEWDALEHALRRRIPVLGICRGLQLINVFFGGTLFQDLETERPGSVDHVQASSWAEHSHGVRLAADSILSRALGVTRLEVNSFHHQAVQQPGRGVSVTGTADDGVVEALECGAAGWVVGVQWHPERHGPQPAASDLAVFSAFADAVRAVPRVP